MTKISLEDRQAMTKVGIDLGYGYVKVYPREEKFRSSVYPHISRYRIEEKRGVVEVEGEVFEVGRARSVELRSKSFQGSPEWRALLYWALRDETLPVKAVIGLPISLSMKETREKLENQLKGIHTAVIDGEEKEIFIKEVKVVPQGMGGSLRLLYREREDLGGKDKGKHSGNRRRFLHNRCSCLQTRGNP